MKLHKAVLAVPLMLALAQGAAAAEANNIFGIAIPESMEEMVSAAYEDTEANFTFKKGYPAFFYQDIQRYDDPRLGYRLGYAAVDGTRISVYVYDLGLKDIPDGVASQAVADELASSAQAIGVSGQWEEVEDQDAAPLSPHFAQAFHAVTGQGGQPMKSYTLVRGQHGFFVKLRITGISDSLALRSAEFIKYLASDLGIEEAASAP